MTNLFVPKLKTHAHLMQKLISALFADLNTTDFKIENYQPPF